jgi:hypothetical protein
VRADLLVTDRPITPSGTGRAAPRLSWSGVSTDGAQLRFAAADLKSSRRPRCIRNYRGLTNRRWTLTDAQQHHWC